MVYKVLWDTKTIKDLKKFDYSTAVKIVNKVENHLAKNPQSLGKALSGTYAGFSRYRFGDYRVIYQIKQSDLVIIILKVGHRSEVYEI
jgi:mRNA interferase RelE/StbE